MLKGISWVRLMNMRLACRGHMSGSSWLSQQDDGMFRHLQKCKITVAPIYVMGSADPKSFSRGN